MNAKRSEQETGCLRMAISRRLVSSTPQKPNAHRKWNSIAFRYNAECIHLRESLKQQSCSSWNNHAHHTNKRSHIQSSHSRFFPVLIFCIWIFFKLLFYDRIFSWFFVSSEANTIVRYDIEDISNWRLIEKVKLMQKINLRHFYGRILQ